MNVRPITALAVVFLASFPVQSVAQQVTVPRAAVPRADADDWHGPATFLVDRFVDEHRLDSWEERKRQLSLYADAAGSGAEVSLRDYRGGEDPAVRMMARSKAALVFHMLRRMVGDEAFSKAQRAFVDLAKFQEPTWDAVRKILEKESGRDLSGFFEQWVDDTGLPRISIGSASVKRGADAYEIRLEILQKERSYEIGLPVTVLSLRGSTYTETVQVTGDKTVVTLRVADEPASVVVDRSYDIARRLTDEERPASIDRMLQARDGIIVLPPTAPAGYDAVVERIRAAWGAAARAWQASDLKDKDLMSSSLVVLGADNPALARLFGTVAAPDDGLGVTVRRNPWNDSKIVAIITVRAGEVTAASWAELLSNGDASEVSLHGGQLRSRTESKAQRGLFMELRQAASAIDVSALKTLDDVIASAAKKRIVYVGEYHDRVAHHAVQLQVLKALHAQDPRIAVGMEMFQRPFQGALDEFVSGAIDEREFLRRSEYFSRWVFDYNLYKPILDFCRAERIPVVALNIRREITEKVSKDGMDGLAEAERAELPDQMDFSDHEYRDRLQMIFEQHRGAQDRKFEYFFQAQVLWDETMARTVDEYLRKHPEQRMLVIAGGGHIAHGSGIPKRAFRRNGIAYSLVLSDVDVEPGIADYIVLPQELEGVSAPKLMVMLREGGGLVTITGFGPGSVAEKAGLRKGDTIVSADGEPVKDTADLKLILHFKKEGDQIAVKVRRKRYLLGVTEKLFTVTL